MIYYIFDIKNISLKLIDGYMENKNQNTCFFLKKDVY